MQPTLSELHDTLSSRVSEEWWPTLKAFASKFYHGFPLADIDGRPASEFAECVYFLWQTLNDGSDLPQITLLNPTVEEHGWACGRTAIVVLQRDMPFLVDSIRIELNRLSLPVHVIKSTVLSVERSGDKQCVGVEGCANENARQDADTLEKEALIYIEVGLVADDIEQSRLKYDLERILGQLDRVVNDYPYMLDRINELHQGLSQASGDGRGSVNESSEGSSLAASQDFLHWLKDSHFTFLGYREFYFIDEDGVRVLSENESARLGVFHSVGACSPLPYSDFNRGMRQFHESHDVLMFAKSSRKSNIHRAIYPDYVVVKLFNESGGVIGEARILGFYTYAVYSLPTTQIPLINQKVAAVLERSGYNPLSHDGKNIRRIIETYPRDELFHADVQTLYDAIIGIAAINERDVVKLFIRKDPFGKFVNSIVYVPRDIYSTSIRQRIERLIAEHVGASEYSSTTYFSESILARANSVFSLDKGASSSIDDVDLSVLEPIIVDMTRGWYDHLEAALLDEKGESEGAYLYKKYKSAFPISYQEHYDAKSALADLLKIESLKSENDIAMDFFVADEGEKDNEQRLRFKVMHLTTQVELSSIIPLLEHLGLRVLGEHPYKVNFERKVELSEQKLIDQKSPDQKSTVQNDHAWIHDFTLTIKDEKVCDIEHVGERFKDAFLMLWQGRAESDSLNQLILFAGLTWSEVVLFRAYTGYMKQTGFIFGREYVANTLVDYAPITQQLMTLFKLLFDPKVNYLDEKSESQIDALRTKILAALDEVSNFNEDRILRRYYELISGTLRTNFFKSLERGVDCDHLVLKFSPQDIPDIPEPRPKFEMYVYSPRVEGVHLRSSNVARGGLRWSDRLQDFRTEVLGLVKAQQVKNAVIVPSGAKGGFVVKTNVSHASREEFLKEGVACYRTFIQGLLDVTDNIIEGEIVPPNDVVCLDEPDPYLVVAADKGTATFSDIANKISIENKHWLGDAFASGGSQGYDHKAMGITAKGAWVSVQRHFREQGVNIQAEDFSVVGIGDMSGDVFGNGMLLSKHICLVAAFNHMHIFVDPTPNALQSYSERQRLFALPRSSWEDYDKDLISSGGGIFSRSQKTIPISPEMKAVFDIQADRLSPNDFISALLKAPVDLIWNGGIGTYVKGRQETHADVGDKSNDGLRVNGADLRCKVFGEGGNLGLSQCGRIEFALNGGACNTDFIDNSAGVDCSDHEVNIKILLDEIVAKKGLDKKSRNQLLVDMTDDVSRLVLDNNYRQTLSLTLAQTQSMNRMNEYRRFISTMESSGRLNRALEYLPDEETLNERYAQGKPLSRPELAVLMCYAKVALKEALSNTNLAEDHYIRSVALDVFPDLIQQRYMNNIYEHRLLKEIVATQIANDMINNLGITAAQRLMDSTGSKVENIAKAYIVARDVFNVQGFFELISSLDYQVDNTVQVDLLSGMMRRVRRGTRWFLRNINGKLSPENDVAIYRKGLQDISETLADILPESVKEEWHVQSLAYQEQGVPAAWAERLSMPKNLFSGLGIILAAETLQHDIAETAAIFYNLYEKLDLSWFAQQLSDATVNNYWQAMARESCLDDLEAQLRLLVQAIIQLKKVDEHSTIDRVVDVWVGEGSALTIRWRVTVNEMQSAQQSDFAMFSVALKELSDLAKAVSRCVTDG